MHILKAADLALFPSRYEPWGYTGQESLTLGVATVLSQQGGLADYLHESFPELIGQFLFLVDTHLNTDKQRKHTIKQLATIMLKSFGADKKNHKQLLKVMAKLDWRHVLSSGNS